MADRSIPTPAPPKENGSDEMAAKEFEAFNSGRNLEQERLEDDHDQKKVTRQVLAWVIRILIVAAGLALIAGLSIWAYHLLAPPCWRWLSSDEINQIQHLVTSALLGMVASEYARRLFN